MTQPRSDVQETDTSAPAPQTSRRGVLAGVGAVGAVGVVAALAGCGTQPATQDSGSGGGSTSTGAPSGGGGIKTSDIPVGGGKIYPDQSVVVTQPEAGQFKAFSSICTHAGCTVNAVADGTIDCPCHGSTFSIKDGSVKSGPAPKPLPAKNVTVSGSTLTVA